MLAFARKLKSAAIPIALASVAIEQPLLAQTETELGSRIPVASPAEIPLHGLSPSDKAEVTILSFSNCVVSRARSDVEHALSLPADGKDYQKSLADLAIPSCLRGGDLKMPMELMRGGLFNALYRKDFMRDSLQIYGKPIDYKKDVSDVNSQSSQSYIALHDFSDCVVRADPAGSRDIVLSIVASVQERTAYSKISPILNGCITAGENLTFSKMVIIGLLSEALYRQSSMR